MLVNRWRISGGGGVGGWGWGSRVSHLGQAGGEEDTLKELPHPLQELVHVGPLQHVHLQDTLLLTGTSPALTLERCSMDFRTFRCHTNAGMFLLFRHFFQFPLAPVAAGSVPEPSRPE